MPPPTPSPNYSGAVSLAPEFVTRIAATFGADGRSWLESLPALLQTAAARWNLQISPPVEPLSYNYVAPAAGPHGELLMLKLGVPNAELASEIIALRHYDGRGSARLVDADEGAGFLLLERLMPGHMLVDYGPDGDEEATRIAAQVMKRLWRPAPANSQLVTVAGWAGGFERLRQRFGGGTGPFPAAAVAEAEATYRRFLATTRHPVLLHGDLHHYNILAAAREPWLAIDPKGIIGDPAYEAGALLRNPLDLLTWPDLPRVLSRRLDILAEELQISRRRLQTWAVAQVVLSAWWTYEDEGVIDEAWETTAALLHAA